MRSSVVRQAQRAAARRRRLHIGLCLLLIAACCALFISYTHWRSYQEEKAREQSLAELQQSIDTAIKVRIDKALARESRARAEDVNYVAQLQAQPDATMTDMAACAVSDPLSYTVIVNKKHCFDPIEWEPDDLVQAEGYYLRTQAADRLIAMMTAAAAADNTFSLSSAYRSYQGQAVTYDTWVAVNGSEASADAVSARPGFSEHQTGLAVDLMLDDCVLECFGTTPQYTWLVAHAAEYGFIQRYPEGLTSITGYETESWHWRYVGIHTATRMKSLGVQTLEAYFDVTGGNYE